MEKRSSHWADVLKWLESVVNSSVTPEHAEVCENLIKNFHKAYEKKIGIREVWNLTKDMERKLWDISGLSFKQRMEKIGGL